MRALSSDRSPIDETVIFQALTRNAQKLILPAAPRRA
jgi:hypothetical protein